MIDSILFFGHAVPGEVHLFPGSAVGDAHVEPVVALRAQELKLDEVTVLQVRREASHHADESGTLAQGKSVLLG